MQDNKCKDKTCRCSGHPENCCIPGQKPEKSRKK